MSTKRERIVKIIYGDPSQYVEEIDRVFMFKDKQEFNFYYKFTCVGLVLHETDDSITITPEWTKKDGISEFRVLPKGCIIKMYELGVKSDASLKA